MKRTLLLVPCFFLGCAESSDGDSKAVERAQETVITPESVRATVRTHAEDIRECHKIHIRDKRLKHAGNLIFTWTVQPEGHVSNLKLEDSTFKNSEFENCVKTEISEIKFPTSNVPRKIRYPFTFKGRNVDVRPTPLLRPETNRPNP